MGGLMDTANFIKEKEADYMYQDVKGKRVDRVYLRANDHIELDCIGLCSAISERGRAYFTLTDFLSEKKLYSQSFDLVCSKERLYSYYKLYTPIKLAKNHFYCFEVEVFGGATYTYTETNQCSTHRDLIIELTRESTKQISSLINLDIEHSKTAKSGVFDEEPTGERSNKKKKSSKLKAKSQNTLDAEPERPMGRKTMVFNSTMPQVDSQVRAKFRKMTHHHQTNMNIISGIVFRRPYQVNACLGR